MECFYRSKPFDEEGKPIRGYRQRMFREWRDRGLFKSTEQRVCAQARAIRRNVCLSQLELETIRLDRMMYKMQKNAQSSGAIVGVSEKTIRERQHG